MEAVQIGPFYVNWRLLTFIVSAIAGYLVAAYMLRRSEKQPAVLPDLLFNALLIGLFAWKAAPFLYHPALLWQSPKSVILSAGGSVEVWTGLLAAGIYVLTRCFYKAVPLEWLADSAAYGAIVYLAVQSVVGGWQYGRTTSLPWGISLQDPNFAYHPLNAYELLVATGLGLFFWMGKIRIGPGRAGQALLVYGGAGLFFVSLFAKTHSSTLGLSGFQWVCLAGVAGGLILPRLYILWEAKQERRE